VPTTVSVIDGYAIDGTLAPITEVIFGNTEDEFKIPELIVLGIT
jgi:hypothetical protein